MTDRTEWESEFLMPCPALPCSQAMYINLGSSYRSVSNSYLAGQHSCTGYTDYLHWFRVTPQVQ